MGRMAELGLAQRDLATLQVLTQEVINTCEIEGEQPIWMRCARPLPAGWALTLAR